MIDECLNMKKSEFIVEWATIAETIFDWHFYFEIRGNKTLIRRAKKKTFKWLTVNIVNIEQKLEFVHITTLHEHV